MDNTARVEELNAFDCLTQHILADILGVLDFGPAKFCDVKIHQIKDDERTISPIVSLNARTDIVMLQILETSNLEMHILKLFFTQI